MFLEFPRKMALGDVDAVGHLLHGNVFMKMHAQIGQHFLHPIRVPAGCLKVIAGHFKLRFQYGKQPEKLA